MRARSHRRCNPAALAAAALVAACQPLPHPFANDRPPADLVKVGNTASVSIAPVEGEPEEAAAKLAGAMADALLKRDIVASEKTMSLGSYQLYGRLIEAKPKGEAATVTAMWRLYDPDGRSVGERSAEAEAKPGDWAAASEQPIEQLAQRSAEALAPLLVEEGPADKPGKGEEERRIRIAIKGITGAPGDGGEALATAVAAVLKGQNLAIAEDGGKADLVLSGEVEVTAAKPKTQHVKIIWRVSRTDGGEVGTVAQENDVPKGQLDGPWGDVAYSVAVAAGDGLLQLVARGAPEPKS